MTELIDNEVVLADGPVVGTEQPMKSMPGARAVLETEVALTNEFKIYSLSQLGTPVGGRYQLAEGLYKWYVDLDFGTTGIDLITPNGNYEFEHINLSLITYAGADAFIVNSGTGILLQWYRGMVTTPNATTIELTNANSFITGTVLFFNCKKAGTLNTLAFLTVVDGLPMVGWDQGFDCINVGVATIQRPQGNGGQNNGGIAFSFSGASSTSVSAQVLDMRLEATESFIHISADYGGEVSILGGLIEGGSFFGPGSRDQKDLKINVVGFPGTDSKTVGSMTVQENLLTETSLVVGEWSKFNFNGLATATGSIEGFTMVDTSTGGLRLDKDVLDGALFASISGFGSGGASNYRFRAVVNDVPVGPVSIVSANEISGTMSATPLLSDVSMIKNQVVELEVMNLDNSSGFTGTHVTVRVQ